MSQLQLAHDSVNMAAPSGWTAKPIIYEINTWVWLNQLSREHERDITLATVPAPELDKLAARRFDAVWLMGVWQRGEATRKSALNYMHEYAFALPDISEADVPGSAYAIHDYQVESRLGGRDGLAVLRQQLQRRGIKLILDFVPNHVATDHPWISAHPEYFIQGTAEDVEAQPKRFFAARTGAGQKLAIAHGRDPYFPAWIDTAQLNAFHPGYRRAAADTLIDIGSQCDGVRCDMAMLATNAIFAQTWQCRDSETPTPDFWPEVISAVRDLHPQMLFMAEVYWDMEHLLQSQGFDYTYDKRMYDRLIDQDISGIKTHLRADPAFLRSNIRFIENHDEPRAMASLGLDRQRAAAAIICTLPGATLLHQGQLEGRRIKLPVQISRSPDEPLLPLLERFYRRLLDEVQQPIYHSGVWRMLEARQNQVEDFSHQNLIVFLWRYLEDARLVVVNLSHEWSRAAIKLDRLPDLGRRRWLAVDALHDTFAPCDRLDLLERGLQVEVPPFGAHIFRFVQDSG